MVVDVCRWFYVVQPGSADVRRKASSVFLSLFVVCVAVVLLFL